MKIVYIIWTLILIATGAVIAGGSFGIIASELIDGTVNSYYINSSICDGKPCEKFYISVNNRGFNETIVLWQYPSHIRNPIVNGTIFITYIPIFHTFYEGNDFLLTCYSLVGFFVFLDMIGIILTIVLLRYFKRFNQNRHIQI